MRMIYAMAMVFATFPSKALTLSYSIPWFTVDGGGNTSAGGAYYLSGTIGQPDAGDQMTGAGYSLVGGFWALPVARETEGSPVLSVVLASEGKAKIFWPAAPGFVLQETSQLSSDSWVDSPSGSTNPVLVPATSSARYYRLHKP